MPVLFGSSSQTNVAITEMQMEVRRSHVDATGLDRFVVACMEGGKGARATEDAR